MRTKTILGFTVAIAFHPIATLSATSKSSISISTNSIQSSTTLISTSEIVELVPHNTKLHPESVQISQNLAVLKANQAFPELTSLPIQFSRQTDFRTEQTSVEPVQLELAQLPTPNQNPVVPGIPSTPLPAPEPPLAVPEERSPTPEPQPTIPSASCPTDSTSPQTDSSPLAPPDAPVNIQRIEIINADSLEVPTSVQQAIREKVAQLESGLRDRTIPPEAFAETFQTVVDAITQIYLNEGYLTSRAVPADTNLNDNILQIQINEGRLPENNIIINNQDGTTNTRLESYARQRILLGATTPLRIQDLEDQLRLLRADTSLFETVSASLRLSRQIREGCLIVTLERADPFQVSVSFDNYSPPSVGSERVSANLSYRSLFSPGDSITTSYYRSLTGGASVLGLRYSLPVNPRNGTLELGTTFDWTRVTAEEFERLNIEGESENYEIGFRQPLIRNPREELALSFTFNYRSGQAFSFDRQPTPFFVGAEPDGSTTTSVFRFAQEYVSREALGAWVLRSQFSLGLDLFNSTINEPSTPDSRFFSWLGQVQRVQTLNSSNQLLLQFDLQLTPDSLLPSEQFVIGGGQSIRGYRQNTRSGDNGLRVSVENRVTLDRNAGGQPILQLAPFIEAGWVWNWADNPNPLPDQTFLFSLGVGLIWQPLPGLSLRLDYGLPLVDLSDRQNNLQDNGLYFNLGYQF